MWPDALKDVQTQIEARVATLDETVNVYLGASAGVPSVNQINIYRGNTFNVSDPTYCELSDSEFVMYIEIWVNEEAEPENLTDIEYENARTLAGYQLLAKISKVIRDSEFSNDEPNYSTDFTKTEGDNDQWRPTCAERIEYLVELRSA